MADQRMDSSHCEYGMQKQEHLTYPEEKLSVRVVHEREQEIRRQSTILVPLFLNLFPMDQCGRNLYSFSCAYWT